MAERLLKTNRRLNNPLTANSIVDLSKPNCAFYVNYLVGVLQLPIAKVGSPILAGTYLVL